MPLSHAYIEIAERYLISADSSLNSGIHESATFQAYHAFESTGGALAVSAGRYYPMPHTRKLNVFTVASNGRPYAIAVAQLAIQLNALRNRCLYPEETPDGVVIRPRNRLTQSQAVRIWSRVKGIFNRVRNDI